MVSWSLVRCRAAALALLSLASCGGESAAVGRMLAAHQDPATWERLDDQEPPRRLRDPRTGIVFVRVPAGEFLGGPAAAPQRYRLTRPFLLAETELTVAQWRRCVDKLGAPADVPVPNGDALPMPLSWRDAAELCARLGYRLPTEIEWERACRAEVDPAAAPWSTPARLWEHAWFNANAGEGSKAVGTRTANAWGLHDMLGNLWEWCADWHAALPATAEAQVDPKGPLTGTARVLRGGSWFTTPGALPDTRTAGFPDERNAFYGLRPARDL